ncbi:uncharacterized protein LOC122319640 [Drosophila yakuba]|uniref:uncharacterized protein LOC122319640 n=1 Tax=Drosophila yakuba TaxID=7245 RepID=UPI001C8A89E8|nr:uncharacterized protein LOC122319640 [Drosophila yakuba]
MGKHHNTTNMAENKLKENVKTFKIDQSKPQHCDESPHEDWLIGTHARRLNAPYNNFCRSCRDEVMEETVEHLVCHCPALQAKRLAQLESRFLIDTSDLSDTDPHRIQKFTSERLDRAEFSHQWHYCSVCKTPGVVVYAYKRVLKSIRFGCRYAVP